MADAGYDVIDQRDIGPAWHPFRRGRGADRRGTRPRSVSSSTWSPNPLLNWGAWVPGGARQCGPGSCARDRYHFRNGRGESTVSCRPTIGPVSSAAWPGRESLSPTGEPGQWYLHLFSAAAGPQLGTTRMCARTLNTLCPGSGSTAVSTVSHRRRALPHQGRSIAGPGRPVTHPASTRLGPGGVARHLPQLAPHRRFPRPDPPRVSGGGLVESPQRLVRYVRPTNCTPRSTSTSSPHRGCQGP